MTEAGQFAFFLASGAASLAVLLGPIGQALARRLGGRGVSPTGLSTGEVAVVRVGDLEHRVEELEAAQARIAELEERLDFAERLLTQHTEVPLPAPRDPA
jgi:hypothetical protein